MIGTMIGMAGAVVAAPSGPPPKATLFETFEPYTPGGLGGQGLWSAQLGDGNKPRIDVVAGSLMDDVNSVKLVNAGSTSGWGYVEYPLTALIGRPWQLTWDLKIPTGATAHTMEIDLLSGLVDPTYAKWSLGLTFKDLGGGAGGVTIYYEGHAAGETWGGWDLNLKRSATLIVNPDGTFTLKNNLMSPILSGVLFAGNETVREYSFSTDGVVPTVSTLMDNFHFETLP